MRYFKPLSVVVLVFTTGIACGIGGYRYGRYSSQPPEPLDEFRVCFVNLVTTNPAPQLREYLKGRLYLTAARYVVPGLTEGYEHFDFGPVDEAILGGVVTIKSPVSQTEIYQAALRRHKPERWQS